MHTSPRAIVVGAGFAGLSAATILLDEGVGVTVLEARERVGGRVWSTTLTNGAIVELGAEWITAGNSAVREAAARFGIPLVETGASYGRREPWGHGAASLEAQSAFIAAAAATRASLARADAAATSVGEFLEGVEGDDAARSIVMRRLAGTCAQDLGRVSLASFGDEAFASTTGDRYFRAGPGNQAIALAMAARVPDLRLGHAVDAVTAGPDAVTVHVGSHAEPAEAVVVAVPAPIAARLSFSPALPDDVATAIGGLPMGEAAKFAVVTKQRPSIRSRQSSALSMWCWSAKGTGGKARRCVASFAGSRPALEALGVTRGEVAPWLDALREMNPDVTFEGEPVLYAWADDPYTLGAYSAWDSASWARRDAFARPVGRIAFAGEHTAGDDHHGTMEGALRSGRRAAEQVLASLARR